MMSVASTRGSFSSVEDIWWITIKNTSNWFIEAPTQEHSLRWEDWHKATMLSWRQAKTFVHFLSQHFTQSESYRFWCKSVPEPGYWNDSNLQDTVYPGMLKSYRHRSCSEYKFRDILLRTHRAIKSAKMTPASWVSRHRNLLLSLSLIPIIQNSTLNLFLKQVSTVISSIWAQDAVE